MTKKQLPERWKRLVEMMQALNFGRIIFTVRSGEPVSPQKVRVVRTVKLSGGDNRPRPETSNADFELRKEVMVLREEAAKAVDGASVTIEVKYGLPFIVEIEEEHQA